ncbi:DUF2782 domain-containing protein [Chitinilyticum aquatile]|uniref:DUF2782 domain-containing protein n=1 Tax=Chitinilyticum aquatile TaxID=362520 RepID=UPI000406DD88|nr:DUF2782 domain-containing protein [Chitinilyticum aquatile]
MKLHHLSLLLALAAMPVLAADEKPAEPVNTAPDEPAAQEAETEVRIVNEDQRTLIEYRLKGRLYMVKVTPKVGKPYYLVDENGDGKFSRRETDGPRLSVPRWTLFEW